MSEAKHVHCSNPDPCPWRLTPAAAAGPCAASESAASPGDSPTQFSLVIPVYRNEESIVRLVAAVQALNERLDRALQVVFVVDGSPDRSYALLEEQLRDASVSAELVCLSRNFGSLAAVRMGLSIARGPYFAVMAADLQEPPELIEGFFRTLATEPIDIALGVRTERRDSLSTKFWANLYWAIYRRLVQRDMPSGGVDVFACNRRARDALLSLGESNSSLVGQLLWMGFRRKLVAYRRLERREGTSAWTFRRKLRYMFDSVFSFTDLPLTMLLAIGGGGLLFSATLGVLVFVGWCCGLITVPGYTPIILTVLASMFCELLGLGVIGAYVWRTYENTKRRPPFLPMLHESFPGCPNSSEEPHS